MSSASGGPPPAKKSLSELSQGELVSKCQTLLGIAQKSKAAKDDAVSKVLHEHIDMICPIHALLLLTATGKLV